MSSRYLWSKSQRVRTLVGQISARVSSETPSSSHLRHSQFFSRPWRHSSTRAQYASALSVAREKNWRHPAPPPRTTGGISRHLETWQPSYCLSDRRAEWVARLARQTPRPGRHPFPTCFPTCGSGQWPTPRSVEREKPRKVTCGHGGPGRGSDLIVWWPSRRLTVRWIVMSNNQHGGPIHQGLVRWLCLEIGAK